MAYENNDKQKESVYSKRIRAGKRRTYFFDVRETRGSDYYLTITESRKRFESDGYDRHKIFLYKEDFNKFIKALGDAIDYVKTDLMPDFDFDAFNHEYPEDSMGYESTSTANIADEVNRVEIIATPIPIVASVTAETTSPILPSNNLATEEVDKW